MCTPEGRKNTVNQINNGTTGIVCGMSINLKFVCVYTHAVEEISLSMQPKLNHHGIRILIDYVLYNTFLMLYAIGVPC